MLENGFVFMAATSATPANPARQHPTSEELSIGKIKFKASTDERKKVMTPTSQSLDFTEERKNVGESAGSVVVVFISGRCFTSIIVARSVKGENFL
jgi:hypothetical protein